MVCVIICAGFFAFRLLNEIIQKHYHVVGLFIQNGKRGKPIDPADFLRGLHQLKENASRKGGGRFRPVPLYTFFEPLILFAILPT